MMGKLISVADLANAWSLSEQRIRVLAPRVPGGQKVGRSWVFPEDAATMETKEQVINAKFRRKEGFLGLPLASEEWEVIQGAEKVQHPLRGDWGALVRNARTGIYALHCGVSFMSVPQDWARQIAGASE